MLEATGRRSRHVGAALAVVLVAAGGAWAGGSSLAAVAAEEPPTCFGMPATIIGTDGDDTLTGTPGNDVIVGLEGRDVIDATSGGSDRVCAGPNALRRNAAGEPLRERITFGHGFVDGGSGLDWIEGYGDQIFGGSNPTVRDDRGRLWAERIVVTGTSGGEVFGGDGPDRIDVNVNGGGGTSAKVDAGAGHDVVSCWGDWSDSCEVYGGTGNDHLQVRLVFRVKLFGGSGNDVLSARYYDIEMDGGSGDDVLLSESPDMGTLRGGPGRDRLTTEQNDSPREPLILQGGTGADNLVAYGAYAQVFGGGPGADTVRAGGGADKVWGGYGRDVLGGADGRDSLYGGAGTDANYGGPGSDLCRSPQRGSKAHSCER